MTGAGAIGEEQARIVGVGPRDGLQNEPRTVATEVKLELIARSPALFSANRRCIRRQQHHVTWARHQEDVRAAQRLRHDVFCGGMGARLETREPGPRHRPHR